MRILDRDRARTAVGVALALILAVGLSLATTQEAQAQCSTNLWTLDIDIIEIGQSGSADLSLGQSDDATVNIDDGSSTNDCQEAELPPAPSGGLSVFDTRFVNAGGSVSLGEGSHTDFRPTGATSGASSHGGFEVVWKIDVTSDASTVKMDWFGNFSDFPENRSLRLVDAGTGGAVADINMRTTGSVELPSTVTSVEIHYRRTPTWGLNITVTETKIGSGQWNLKLGQSSSSGSLGASDGLDPAYGEELTNNQGPSPNFAGFISDGNNQDNTASYSGGKGTLFDIRPEGTPGSPPKYDADTWELRINTSATAVELEWDKDAISSALPKNSISLSGPDGDGGNVDLDMKELNSVTVGDNSNPTDVTLIVTVADAPPAAPTGLTATAGDGKVTLSWNPNTESDIDSYKIYRKQGSSFTSTGGSGVAEVGEVNHPTTSFEDTGASNGNTYYYRVTALDVADSESDLSSDDDVKATPVTATITRTIDFNIGWNLISVPVSLSDMSYANVMPSDCSTGFGFNGSFSDVTSSTLSLGQGYYVKCSRGLDHDLEGEALPDKDASVSDGWNLVGPFDTDVDASDVDPIGGGTIETDFFAFAPNTGFTVASTLKVGKGYWVKTSGTSELEMDPAKSSPATTNTPKRGTALPGAAQLTVTDGASRSATLRMASGLSSDALGRYEMPPKLSHEVFDVRFANGGYVASTARSQTVEIQGTEGPITLRVNGLKSDRTLHVTTANGFSARIDVNEPTAQIPAGTKALTVTVRSAPSETTLAKTYPNPVSGQSTVEFTLAEQRNVTISVYDVLGREITTLVSGPKQAGVHRAQLDASTLQSGVYFYRLRAGDVMKTQRFTVVR